MKDSRIGESLWFIWDGEGYLSVAKESIVFYTEEHIDVENETVRKALASSIQREGIAASLGQSFHLIDVGVSWHGYVGISDISESRVACDESGETVNGEFVQEIVPVTWVEVFDL